MTRSICQTHVICKLHGSFCICVSTWLFIIFGVVEDLIYSSWSVGFLFFNCNRGNLNLSLLPTSELRISFIGDDGSSERLATLSNDLSCFTVEIEELVADPSGRSFSIRIPDDEIFYFWCSEKSKLLGMELLRKVFLPAL